MANWQNKIKLKHLFTDKEDLISIQASMTAIADELDKAPFFRAFVAAHKSFRVIPAGDDVFGPVDYANRLLSELYDYADDHRIWIE